MSKLIDLTGQRFGRLTVIERAENAGNKQIRWLCKCDCGGKVTVRGDHLRSSYVLSCGCLNRENTSKRSRKLMTKHGLYYTRLYKTWSNMKDRCCNPKNRSYPRYGGRGITVCEEWLHNFQAFYDWAMANGYRDDLSIDRIDNDKGYSSDNCRWATAEMQLNNVSTNRRVTINGKIMTLKQWCELFKMNYETVRYRLNKGWTPEEAFGLIPRKK